MNDIQEEMEWIVAKGKELQAELVEAEGMKKSVLMAYGDTFSTLKAMKRRYSEMCIHTHKEHIISYGIPTTTELNAIACISRFLAPAREDLKTLSEVIRCITIDIKSLRAQWSELNEEMKEANQ